MHSSSFVEELSSEFSSPEPCWSQPLFWSSVFFQDTSRNQWKTSSLFLLPVLWPSNLSCQVQSIFQKDWKTSHSQNMRIWLFENPGTCNHSEIWKGKPFSCRGDTSCCSIRIRAWGARNLSAHSLSYWGWWNWPNFLTQNFRFVVLNTFQKCRISLYCSQKQSLL
jgi:hypothetical protein